jgi:hypothetical protein
MMEDVGLDDVELVRISTKDLNRHLKKRGIEKKRQTEVKQRRRTLKNRFRPTKLSTYLFAAFFALLFDYKALPNQTKLFKNRYI